MLEAILHRAEKLKQGLQVLLDISKQCWLQVNRVGMLFGVEMVDHRVPALLSLDWNGFQTYKASEEKELFSWTDAISFNLVEFWDIIRLWDDDNPIRFSIPHSGQPLYVYSVVEPVTIIVWRSMVMTISQTGQRLKRRIFIKNYVDTTPHHKYSIFHLTLHRGYYFLKAARVSRWIKLIAEDHNKGIYVPSGLARMFAHIKENPSDARYTPRDISRWTKLIRKFNGHRRNVLNKPPVVMTTVLDRFTKITFYLLLDSVVQPCVEFGSSSPNFDLLE